MFSMSYTVFFAIPFNSKILSNDSYFLFATLGHTFLRVSGGAIPVAKYQVIVLQAWLISGSSKCACFDVS